MNKLCVALDLGGVLVDIDKARLYELPTRVRTRWLQHHDAFQDGLISTSEFLRHGADAAKLSVGEVKDIWSSIPTWKNGSERFIRTVRERGYAVSFWSNIDPLHAAHLDVPGADNALSYDIGARKPDRRFFDAAKAKAGSRPILFFDDKAENCDAAIAFGVRAVHVDSTFHSPEALLAHLPP